ncbi:AAA family ATPase [Chitinophaga sp. Cy-1792]|uniref:AAA family ATPase n=1 Tax=Chitinophaga sp. Cy-1792 TaxID=2608339 RepID=UPI00142137FB|nr:AAA family ATPase [Chitinophaga sp. Cy-1792]NIG53875.1 AAA family ATPase [Chitinophaga sp. Cy-1792]
MNKIGIERIRIRKFLDQYDIDIPLDGPMKIFIGENGMGKTQILNIIYYILSRNFSKLRDYTFEEIEIVFDKKNSSFINKEILNHKKYKSSKSLVARYQYEKIVDIVGYYHLENLFSKFENERPSRNKIREYLSENNFKQKYNVNEDLILEFIEDYFYLNVKYSPSSGDSFEKELDVIDRMIKERIGNSNILYFPTFRRVEEELKNLGYDEEAFKKNKEDNRLIHFGMDDVQKRFDTFTGIIDRLSKEGFAKLSGEILSQLVKGIPNTNPAFIQKLNGKDVQIILERIGKEMSIEDKEKILAMINNKEVKDQDPFLLYFLEKLFDIYDQQREYDTQIKAFQSICNSYLVHKEVYYDESGMKIYIKNTINDSKIQLSKLSSGEKQIISILSRIYLSMKDQTFIVLFDEPELSLSIFWQRRLLPDIVNSNKCPYLLAVTHSPFIFENELDRFAISLQEYYTPILHDNDGR